MTGIKEKTNKFEIVVVICLLLGWGWWLWNRVAVKALVLWDEAMYISQGFEWYKMLINRDWTGLVAAIKGWVEYPFLPAMWLSWWRPHEFTVETARLANLMLIVPSGLLIWLIGRVKEREIWLRLVSLGLFLASPLLLFFFATALRESVGLLLAMLSLYLYFLARKRKNYWFYLGSAAALAGLFFVKFYYGTIGLGALGLELMVSLVRREIKLSVVAMFILPVILIIGSWVLMPTGNLIRLMVFMRNIADHQTDIWAHVYFYGFHLANSFSFSWVVFGFLVVGLIRALIKNFGDYWVRSLIFLFLVNLFLFIFRTDKNQVRYLYISVPAFFLVGSWGLGRWRKLLVPLLLVGLIMLPKKIGPTASHNLNANVFYETEHTKDYYFNFNNKDWPRGGGTNEKIEDIFNFVLENTDGSVSLAGGINELSPFLFDFKIGKYREIGEDFVVVLEIEDGSIFNSEDFQKNNFEPLRKKLEKYQKDNDYSLAAEKNFDELGMIIRIFEKAE